MLNISKKRKDALLSLSKTDFNSNMEDCTELGFMLRETIKEFIKYHKKSDFTYLNVGYVLDILKQRNFDDWSKLHTKGKK